MKSLNVVKIQHSKSERRSKDTKGKLLSKLKVSQFLASKKISNFRTAQEFFQSYGNSFMPLNNFTTVEPQQKRQTKFRIHKWHDQSQRDANSTLSQNKLRKTIVGQAFNNFYKQNYQTILKASSVSPSPRRITRKDVQSPESSSYETMNRNFTAHQRGKVKQTIARKNFRKKQLVRSKYFQKPEKIADEPISGWNGFQKGWEFDNENEQIQQ